jgi:hypothetical protein
MTARISLLLCSDVSFGSILLKKGSGISTNHDSVFLKLSAMGTVMMGRQTVDQSQLFYLFNLEEQIPADHLLRRLNPIVTRVLVDLRQKLAPFYSDIGITEPSQLDWPDGALSRRVIACVNSCVDAFPLRSGVRTRSSRSTLSVTARTWSARSMYPTCSNIRQAARRRANGLATPFPAISGAEP